MSITREDLKAVLGEMEEAEMIEILALKPTLAELEEAAIWAAGDGDILGKEGRPLSSTAAAIVEILTANEEEPEPTGSTPSAA